MRIRGAKTELEEAGESTEGMAESTASLRQEMLALSGVDIMLDNNTFKSTYQIMDELSAKWKDLTDIQQATIIELVAGKHQGNVFASLMANFDIAREALETSVNSAGSAMAEHAKWSESLEARLNKLKAAWQSLSQSFMSSNFLKGALDGVIALVDGIGSLIDTLGMLPTFVGAFTAFESFKGGGFFKTIRDEATGTATGITNAFTDIRRQAGRIFMDMGIGTNTEFRNSLQSDIQALSNYKVAVQGGMSKTEAFSTYMDNASESAKAYANANKVATLDIVKFNDQQKAAQVTLNASNKSMASAKAIMAEYNNGCKNTAMTQTDFVSAVGKGNPALGKYLSNLNGAKAGMTGYVTSLVGAKVATIALQVATTALNMALTMGISALITWGISKLDEWIETADELAERIGNVTSEYEEQHKSLMKMKDDFDTSNEDSLISKYGELSKGVDEFGENLSLTADEYAEYQNIVNTIADQLPSLVSGYNSQGDAILSCAGDVDKLTESYRELIKEQNSEVLKNGADIFKDFKNDLKDTSAYYRTSETKEEDAGIGQREQRIKRYKTEYSDNYDFKHLDKLEELMSLDENELESTIENLSVTEAERISKLLEEQGIERDVLGSGEAGWETQREHIIRALGKDKKEIKKVLDDAAADLNKYAEELGTVTEAYFSDAFLGDYANMSDRMQNIITQVTSGFGSEFYADFLNKENPYEELTKYYDSLLTSFDSLSGASKNKLETTFDLKTQFNGGDINYGEYINNLREANSLIDGMVGIDDDIKAQLKLNLNTDEAIKEYDSLVKRLTSKDIGWSEDSAKKFLNGLSAEEFSIATHIIPKLDADTSIAEIQAMIDKEIALKGLTLNIDIAVEKANLEALSTAIGESVSGVGLSSESISAIESMYSDLASYDSSKLFERTANGISLNSTELRKLNDESKKTNVAKINKQMGSLGDIYNQTREELYQLTYGTDEYNSKLLELDGIEQQIKDLEKLSAGYDGVASAYQEWQMMESAGSQRTMYEGILEGWQNVEDEISRGWIDDGTREFLELLKGEKATIIDGDGNKKEINIATASAKDLEKVWKSLDDTIKHTTYSVEDFFTVDDDGNSTSKGVYNFLDAIGQMEEEKFNGKDVVKRDKKGNIIGFDFQMVGGDKVIAEALGISEELVQIMKRASADAGFVVTLDGSFEQLDILREKAQKAADVLNKALKNKGQEDKIFSYNFNSTDEEDITKQLEKANKALNTFKKSGKIDLSIEGASEALTVTSTLQSMLDNLQRPAYMQIEVSQVEKDLQEPLRNLQELRTLTETEHQFKISGTDTSELEKSKQEIYNYFEGLDTDVKVKLGLVDEKGNPLTGQALKDKLNSGDIAIEATIDIQMEMDEKLGILVDKALLEAGIIDEEEFTKRVNVYLEADVDNDDAKNKTENATEEVVGEEKETKNIEVIAEVLGIEDVDGLADKLDGLDNTTIQAIAEVLGNVEVDKLKLALSTMTDVQVQAIAEAIGEGDVEGLKTAIGNLDSKTIQAIAEAFGYSDVNELIGAINNLDPKTVQAVAQALGLVDVNTLQTTVNNMQGNKVPAEVDTTGQANKVTTLQGSIDGLKGNMVVAGVNTDGQADKVTSLQTKIDSLKGRIVTVGVQLAAGGKKKAAQRTGADPAGNDSEVNGTAHIKGTAFKQGDWRTKKTERALTGELGREIVVTPQNRWYTVGDNGAEFVNIPRGSIVFNHRQTEELLKNGKAISDGGRARALANGTAFLGGTAHLGEGKYISPKNGSISISNYKKPKDSKNEDFEETLDFIEVALSRIQREIDRLDKKANNVYKSWSSRNTALVNQISMVRDEIKLQEKAYNGYMSAANKIGLSSSWAEKVRNGAIDISNVKDETLKQKIDDYKSFYEKALDCQDAILELKETESALIQQKFDNIIERYDGYLSVIEHEKNMLEEYMAQSEAQGWMVSEKYYNALVKNEQSNINMLQKQKNELIARLGDQEKGTQQWYDNVAAIDEVTLAIEQANTSILEYKQSIQELKWEQFDLLQDRIFAVTEEANFLIELLNNDKLHDDNGKLTDEGLSTIGLHGQNYNAYMYQADLVAKEIKRLEKEMKTDKYDDALEERYREMIAKQQEFILSAESEKDAIKDLVENGIELELDALQERIDKYNEALESQKDLYDYQKKAKEQTKEIASLEKQMAAYARDDSEEARQKIQQIKVDLESAREELQETEYEKYISDQEKLLDDLYLEYEETINTRLDNVDVLVSDMIAEVNTNSNLISTTLYETADSVGYTLSDSMSTIWDTNSTKINDVIADYGSQFTSLQTSTNSALGAINSNLQSVIGQLNTIANTKVESAKTSSASVSNKPSTTPKVETTKTETKKPVAPTIKVGGKINAGSAKIYDYAGDTSGERQYYRNDPVYKVLSEKNGYLKVRWHKLSSGVTGWFKKSDVKALATGARKIMYDDIAWTQEKGQEFIVRPSDGAILTPVAKGDSVLNASASNNIWNMANSPTEFIKDNLKFGTANVPNNTNTQSNLTQNFDKVIFNMPNVKNYGELLTEMQRDPKFEKLILSMTIDQIAGKSSLAKGKAIR